MKVRVNSTLTRVGGKTFIGVAVRSHVIACTFHTAIGRIVVGARHHPRAVKGTVSIAMAVTAKGRPRSPGLMRHMRNMWYSVANAD